MKELGKVRDTVIASISPLEKHPLWIFKLYPWIPKTIFQRHDEINREWIFYENERTQSQGSA
jgi:hypothetical protein